MTHLNRELAPFASALWDRIDEAAAEAAKQLLTARRFLDLDGPHGLGLTSLEVGEDDYVRQEADEEAAAVMSRAVSVPMLRKGFRLSVRRIQSHLSLGQPLELTQVQDAAEAVARREEELIYRGHPELGHPGLLTAEGIHAASRGDWSRVEQAIDDVLRAVGKLDAAGFLGPYALALPPPLYNDLFRHYQGTELLQLDHLSRLCQLGVHKAPIDEAVLVDARAGDLVLGQDLMVGYSGTDGVHYELFVTESIALRLLEPKAICKLSA